MDIIATLFLAFIALVIGVLLGLLFSGLRGSSKKSAGTGFEDLDAVVGLWRDGKTGQLVTTVGEKVFRFPDEMNQGERELLGVGTAKLRNWSELSEAPEPEGEISTTRPPAGRESRLRQTEDEISHTGSEPAPGKNLNPFKVFGTALKPSNASTEGSGSRSIVLQIDEILQEKLKGSSLEGRGIRLVDHPGEGMAVAVGLDSYGSIEEVPDPEIRDVIRQAVSEWESRMMGK